MSTTDASRSGLGPNGAAYDEVQASQDFAELRRRFRSFVFPMTALFLAWYFLYVLLAAYAPQVMARPVFGNVNVGILLGLGQFVSTLVITLAYRRWADRRLDPVAESLRNRVEGHGATHGEGTVR